MRKLIWRVGNLCGLFVVTILTILALSSQQSHSALAQSFHLFECSTSCWLDIQPGKTLAQDAVQKLISTFGEKGMLNISGSSGERELSATFSGVVSQFVDYSTVNNRQSPLEISLQVENGIVSEISLSSLIGMDGKPYRALPSLGELVANFGVPTCVISLGKTQKLILNRDEGSIEVNISSPLTDLAQPAVSLIFYKPGKVSDACRSAPQWAGFGIRRSNASR